MYAMCHLINLVNVTHITDATVRLCFPNDTKLHNDYRFEATDRKVELNKLKTQAARLTRKGSAGVWVWNSKIQVGQYLSLRKISSTSSAKFFINRFSRWATDGKAGHTPPSTEMMPAKLLEKLKEFKGYRWSSNWVILRELAPLTMLLGGDLWSEDYPGVSKWMEAQTDRLDYDLRGWEPVEYEYLKVYPAVNSESKISEYTEDGDLIRVGP
ncbi:hypothetical protein PPACK8108_LOCUS16508 [Phakopsora pachyrhizi]|uniref:Uncharacterized protein n=1 Tax=Phakopsora pachyrhizi TaxID=170000 RepID=A0AAV0BAI8_PHAPC|nr:hypothetical protein PPACK8108_LOCUS16508 [Phakopsora pachyrhizi]